MPKYVAVSREHHSQKKWRRYTNYAFAAREAAVPIIGAEVSSAAMCMPCAFLERAGGYTLVAVLSLVPGRNMFLGPDGRWLGGYIPAELRFYPFRLIRQQGTDNSVLCVDEQSGLVVEGGGEGESFVDAEGNLAASLKPIFDALTRIELSRKASEAAVASLAEAGVIRPWQLRLKTDEGVQPVGGFNRVDEVALRDLSDENFLRLRSSSGLPVAYAQILSMRQIAIFEQLARVAGSRPAAPQLPLTELPETLDGLLENLKDDLLKLP